MDRGPGGSQRTRGNAFYVENARAALGVRSEAHSLSDVPLPLIHTALGIAVCAVAAAFGPQAVGLHAAVLVTGALAIATAGGLTLYDHLVYGRAFRHAVAAMALPVAAITAFVVVLGGSETLTLRLPAGVLSVLVIGGVPHLGGLRAAGREGMATRLIRDAAGVAVLAPILIASFGGGLAPAAAAALAGFGVLLVSFDALLTEGLGVRTAGADALLVGSVFAGLVELLPATGRGSVRAASLLILWYGARGVLAALAPSHRRVAMVGEYLVFIAAASAGLAWGVLHP